MSVFSQLRPAVVSTLWFTAILGIGYPLLVTGASVLALPAQARGSVITDGKGQVLGSTLIAQGFAKPEYLHPRPSAAGKGYDATASGGSNLGPLNPDLVKRETDDAEAMRKQASQPIPADAVTTSGSGLDPDISPENARMQVARVALARGADAAWVQAVIDTATEAPLLGFIGQPRVNVLKANMALDARLPVRHPAGP